MLPIFVYCILYIVYCVLCMYICPLPSGNLLQFAMDAVAHLLRWFFTVDVPMPDQTAIQFQWLLYVTSPFSSISMYIHVYIYIYPHDPSLSIACGLLPWFLNCLFGSEPFFLDTAVAFDFERSPNLSVYQPTIYLVSPHVWPGQRIWNCPENDFLTSWWPGKPKWVWPVWPGKNLHSVQAAWWKMAPSCGYNQFLCDGHEAIWGGP